MSQRRAKEQKRREQELAAQRKQQRRNRFWRIAPLAAGLLVLGAIALIHFAGKNPKKIEEKPKTLTQGEINIMEGDNIRAARKLLMTAPLYENNPMMTYHVALSLLNSSGIVARSLAHRGITELPDMSPLLRVKPELEPYLALTNNGRQGNAFKFEFDLRVVPLVQLLDLIIQGDGYVREINTNKILAFSDLLSNSSVKVGYDPVYETYSTQEVFKRDALACGDLTIMIGTIMHICGAKFIPIYAFPFFDSGDERNDTHGIEGVGHAILGVPTEDGFMILDPSARELSPNVDLYLKSCDVPKFWFNAARKERARPPVSQWPNAKLRFALMLMPPASEVPKAMVPYLLNNQDSLAFEQIPGGISHFMFLKRKEALDMLNREESWGKILKTVQYVEIGIELPK